MAEKEIYHLNVVIGVQGDEDTKKKLSVLEKYIDQMEKKSKTLSKINTSPSVRINDKASKQIEKVNLKLSKMKKVSIAPVVKIDGNANERIDEINNSIIKLKNTTVAPKVDINDRITEPSKKINSTLDKLNKNVEARASIIDKISGPSKIIFSNLNKIKSTVWTATINARDRASGIINTIKGGIGSVLNMATSLEGVLLGVGGAWAGVVKPMQISGDFEQTQIAFDTMLHSAEKANDFLSQAQNMANNTPFEFPQLANASKKLLAFGWDVKNILPDLNTIGDASSGLGLGAEGINQITLALGQMKAKGRVQGDEILQLTEAGIPAAKILQEQLGLTADQVANIGNQSISADKAITALLTGMDKRFGGMMQQQSKTALGLMSTLKDTLENKILNQWGAGLWSGIKPGLGKVTDWLDKNDKKVTELGTLFRKSGENVSKFIGGGLEKAQSRLNKLMDSSQWKNADLGEKITLSWNKIIVEPLSDWWSGDGRSKINKVAGDIGSGIGGILGGGIITVLDAFSGGDGINKAGTTAGQSFLDAFVKAFDPDKIINKLLTALKNTNLNAVKNPSTENFAKAALLDYGVYAAGAGALIKGGAKVAKGGVKASKWLFGKPKVAEAVEESVVGASRVGSMAATATSSEKISKTTTNLKDAAKSFRNAANDSKAAENAVTKAESLRNSKQSELNKAVKSYKTLQKEAANLGKNIPESLSNKLNKSKSVVDKARSEVISAAKEVDKYKGNASSKKDVYNTARDMFKNARTMESVPKVVEDVPLSRAARVFSKVGEIGKKMPGVGTAIGILGAGVTIATSDDKKRATAKTSGGLIGGVAGSKLGAGIGGAVGTMIMPGVGTAVGTGVGSIAGGIAGSMAGGKAFDWVYTKSGPAIKYLKSGFGEAKKSVQTSWDGFGKWFDTSVSKPVSSGFNDAKKSTQNAFSNTKDWFNNNVNKPITNEFSDAKKSIHDKWSNTKSWFGNNIGTPVKNGAINTVNFTVGAFSMGKDAAAKAWKPYGEWWDTNVSTPVNNAATNAGVWISQKYGDAKEWSKTKWNDFSTWWSNDISTPVKNTAKNTGEWIGQKYGDAKEWSKTKWSDFSTWWGTNISTPVKNAAENTGQWIGQKYSEAKQGVSNAWISFSGWWGTNVSTPVNDAATNAGVWISQKYGDAKEWTKNKWSDFSTWWDTNISTPVENAATTAGDWIGKKLSAARATAESAWVDFSTWFEKHISGPVSDFIEKAKERGQNQTGLQPSTGGKDHTVKANGGITTGPEFSLIGEAGTEAVIPLSSSRRNRGLSLWQQAGKMLGVRMFANGGIVGNSPSTNNKTLEATANISTSIALGDDMLTQFKDYGNRVNISLSNGILENKKVSTDSVSKVANESSSILNLFSKTGHIYGVAINNDITSGIQSSIGNVTSMVKTLTDKVIEQFKTGFGIHSPSRVFYRLSQFIPQGMINSLKDSDIGNFIKKWVGNISSMAGGAVGGNISGWLSAAMAITGTPMGFLPMLQNIAMHESGGNPNSINLWDSNAKAGHPSKGLMQMIDETFNRWALPGMNDIWNPVDNAVSSIRYMIGRYGSIANVPGIRSEMNGGSYVGYATGTNNAAPGEHPVAERGFEIITGKRLKMFNGGEKVYNNGDSKRILDSLSPRYYTSQPQMAMAGISYGDINVDVDNNFSNNQDIDEIVIEATKRFATELRKMLQNTKI